MRLQSRHDFLFFGNVYGLLGSSTQAIRQPSDVAGQRLEAVGNPRLYHCLTESYLVTEKAVSYSLLTVVRTMLLHRFAVGQAATRAEVNKVNSVNSVKECNKSQLLSPLRARLSTVGTFW